jgi:hypothetical protein
MKLVCEALADRQRTSHGGSSRRKQRKVVSVSKRTDEKFTDIAADTRALQLT